MKKRVFLIALAVFPFSTFAVDISNMHSIVFIDESSDDIDGDFRERYDCDEGGTIVLGMTSHHLALRQFLITIQTVFMEFIFLAVRLVLAVYH